MVALLLLVVLIVCAVMSWREGLWGAAIILVNSLLAALLAANYFEPAAAVLEGIMPTYTYFFDFIALWGLFVLAFGMLRGVTGLISKYRVRFIMLVELAGRTILAIWVGWVMVCFSSMTLHAAPLPRHAFGGSFQQKPMSGDFFGLAPDRQWLGFMQSRSRGALSKFTAREFDPQSEFIFKYGSRRQNLQEYCSEKRALRVEVD